MGKKGIVLIALLISFIAVGVTLFNSRQKIVSPHGTRLYEELRTGIQNGLFGEFERKRVVLIEKDRLEHVLKSLVFYMHDSTPCGYDFYLIVYRTGMSHIEISVNTKCRYFTLHFPNDNSQLGRGEFYALTGEFERFINQLISDQQKSHRYRYQCQVPTGQSFRELSTNLHKDEHFAVMGEGPRKAEGGPFIMARYSDDLSSCPGLSESEIMEDHKLGELKPDDRFNLLITDPRLRERIESCSSICFKEGGSFKNDMRFVREIKIFLYSPISDEDQHDFRNLWENANGKDSFEYSRPAFYSVDIITDKILDKPEMDSLTKKYCIKEIS